MVRPSLATKPIDFGRVWPELRNDLIGIISDPLHCQPKYSWETLHRSVYRICTGRCFNLNLNQLLLSHQSSSSSSSSSSSTQPPAGLKCTENTAQPHLLYYLVKESIAHCLSTEVNNEEKKKKYFEQNSGIKFLNLYLEYWKNYSLGIEVLNGIFLYMNRQWVSPNQTQFSESSYNLDTDIYPIKMLGYLLFRKYFLEVIQNNLRRTLLDLVLQNRQMGEQQFDQYDILQRVIQSFVQLGFEQTSLYESVFETVFLNETRKFYTIECATIDSISDYITSMLQHLRLEEKICHKYLLSSTHNKLMNVCIDVMIHMKMDILFSVLDDWFKWDNRKALKNFFSLMQYSPDGRRKLTAWFQDYVVRTGEIRLESVRDDRQNWKNYVDLLISFYFDLTALVEDCFDREADMIIARDAGLKYLLSHNGSAIAEYFAKKVNMILRGTEKLTEEETERQLNTILKLCTLLPENDVFLKYYSVFLARRLIQRAYVQDTESLMIGKLKQVCSFGEVYKLNRMFNDLQLAENLNARFKNAIASSPHKTKTDFSALILTYGSWPIFEANIPCKIPRDLKQCYAQYEEFYHSQHQGRKLQWISSMSKGLIKSHCFNAPYEFRVSAPQLSILFQFNDRDQWMFEELCQSAEIDPKQATSVLDALLKSSILKSSSSSDIGSNDTISLNLAFTSKNLRISLFSVATKHMSAETHGKVNQQIDNDRKYAIQASIVRLMKARKRMEHRELVHAVLLQLQLFKPTLMDIKKNIEHLIDMEYLSRDETNQQEYKYLA